MLKRCPHCNSIETILILTFTPVLTALGAAGGIAVATATFAVRNSPSPTAVTKIPSYLITCTAAGAQGAVMGKKLGQEIDQKHFPRYECKKCREIFPPLFSMF